MAVTITEFKAITEDYLKKVEELEQSLVDLSKQEKKTGDEGEKAFDGAESSVDGTTKSVNNLQKSFDSLTKNIRNVVIGFVAFNGVQRVLGDAVKTVIEFQSALSQLEAITGATGEDLDFLRQRAIDLGAETTIAAQEVLEGFQLIASAKPELLDNAAALATVTEAAITLSEAAGIELSAASIALTDALNQFNAPAEDAGKFINVLASASQQGSVLVPQLTGAITEFGAIARSANISIEQSAALVETLGENGIDAARSGIQLRNFLTILQSGADDTNPAIVGLNEALINLGEQNLTTAELTKRFGRENQVAAQLLIENAGRVDDLTQAVTGTQTALEQATVNTDNLSGDLDRLSNSYDSFILSLESGDGVLSRVSQTLIQVADSFLDNLAAINSNETAYEELVRIQTNAADVSDTFGASLKVITNLFRESSAETLPELNEELDRLRNIYNNNKEAIDENELASRVLQQRIQELSQDIIAAQTAQEESTTVTEEATQATEEQAVTIASLQRELSSLQEDLKQTEIGTQEFNRLKNEIDATKEALDDATGSSEKVRTATEQLKDRISELRQELESQALAGELNNETLAEYEAATQKAKDAQELLDEALKGSNSALQAANEEVKELKTQLEEQAFAGQINNETLERFRQLSGQIEESQKALKEALEVPVDNELEKSILREETALLKVQGTEEQVANERAAIREKLFQLRLDLIDREIDKEEEGSQRFLELEKERAEVVSQFNEEQKQEQDERSDEERERRQETLDATIQTVQAVADFIGQINAAATERELQDLENRREAILNNENLTQEEREKLQQEFDEERRQILTEQARQEKALAIFQATVNGAAAVIAQLAIPGAGIALAAAAAVTAALQVAAIIATPIPTFHTGGVDIGNGQDEFNALLQRGETVTTRARTQQYKPELEAIHNGKLEDYIQQNYINPEIRKIVHEIEQTKEKDFATNLANSLNLMATTKESAKMLHFMKETKNFYKKMLEAQESPRYKSNRRHV